MSTRQSDFFDVFAKDALVNKPAKIARDSDPVTSHRAAKSIANDLPNKQRQFMERLRSIGQPSTANEVADGVESIRKRARELVRDGYLVSRGSRPCRKTGHEAEVFWFAEKTK